MQLKASAPGSLMLLGEYGVLYGKQALVCAVDKRITVKLTPRGDQLINISSSLHGQYTTELTQLIIEKPFHFVLGAIKQYLPLLKRGCDIEIESEFSDKVGLGSSAAVTVATLAALISWLNVRLSPVDLIRQGRNVVQLIQGVGSGADISAAVYGGIVAYQAQPLITERFAFLHPLTAIYAGFKTPTVDAIRRVQNYFTPHPNLFRQITNAIGQCVTEGIHLLRRQDWSRFGDIMNVQQGMLESLKVSLPLLHNIVEDLRQQKGILGAKISGSGLGDCVVGLGEVGLDYHLADSFLGVKKIPVVMTLQGVYCEKI